MVKLRVTGTLEDLLNCRVFPMGGQSEAAGAALCRNRAVWGVTVTDAVSGSSGRGNVRSRAGS
jgi:hypothetical protein